MGLCMAHLNCLAPRAAGVNYWFSLLAHLVVGVDIMQNVKSEMQLHKIDGEMNMQNCGFSTKLRNGDGGDILHDWWQRQLSWTRTIVFFEAITRCRRQKHCWRRPDNPNGPSKFRKYRVYLPLLHPFTSAWSWLLDRGWPQRQLPLTRTVIFRRDDMLPTSKTSLKMIRQP